MSRQPHLADRNADDLQRVSDRHDFRRALTSLRGREVAVDSVALRDLRERALREAVPL